MQRDGVWTIVVAAGSGTRFGGPKQLAPLAGERVLDHSIRSAAAVSEGVTLVLAPALVGEFELEVGVNAGSASGQSSATLEIVAGGDTRSASVRAGLAVVPDSASVIVVHDGARPLATVELFERTITAVRAGADAAIPTVPVTDTIRHIASGVVDRSQLVSVQTPQTFNAAKLRAAHEAGGDATDDAGLVEADGGTVVLVAGLDANLKITNPDDLAVAEALLASRTGIDPNDEASS